MRRATRIAAAVVLAGLFPLASTLPVWAEEPAAYGWWYRPNTRQAKNPLGIEPTHPGVPEDGLLVARDAHPTEPLAVAALTYTAPSGAGAVLELKIEPGSMLGNPEVFACPITESFASERPGSWEDAPQSDCAIAADGEVIGEPGNPESMIWHLPPAFEVFPEFWNILLTPSRDTTQEPFQVAFQAPDDTSFSVQPASDFGEEPPPPPPAPPPEPPPASDFGTPDFAPPPAFTEPVAPPASEPVTIPEPEPTPAPEPVQTAGAPVDPADDTFERFVAAGVLIAIAAGLASVQYLGSPSQMAVAGGSAPVADASASDGPVRGLGRFARPRGAPPRRLV